MTEKKRNRQERIIKRMTIKECYDAMGADYSEVERRLRKEERIKKFLCKVPEDESYMLLYESLEQRNMDEAFRAAHTMKGICQNLALTELGHSAAALSERLRDRREYAEDVEELFAQVQKDYARAVECIRQL